MDEIDYSVGNLLPFRNLTDEQKNLFIKLISDDYTYIFQILFNIINDDKKTLELLDILSGQRIQFPSRKKLYKLLEKIQMYTYSKHRNFSEESYKIQSKIYKKRISQIKNIVTRIDYLLNSGKYKGIEDEEEKIKEKQHNIN